jgi:flagellar biosynthesis protein FlhG
MEQAVRAYVPVIQHAPASPGATALMKTAEALMQLLSTSFTQAA